MNSSERLFALLKECEGFKSTPYRCPAGIPTIGYGSTRYADGRPVKLTDPPISEQVAQGIMKASLKEYEGAVNRYVIVPLNQNQYDALVDFAYNAGSQNLRTSTLLRKLNAGDYAGAAGEFDRWVMGGGKKLAGLVKRRAAERKLFEEVCS